MPHRDDQASLRQMLAHAREAIAHQAKAAKELSGAGEASRFQRRNA